MTNSCVRRQSVRLAFIAMAMGGVGSLPPTANAQADTQVLTGHVLDAQTKLAVRGAEVMLDDAKTGPKTGEDGSFRFAGVSAGEHDVTVRMVGYTKQSKRVRVTDGEVHAVEFLLMRSVNALDQVVVTGTVIETELRAVSNAITVIDAKQIEERGITRIDQLFRGDVPGLFAQNASSGNQGRFGAVYMFSRGATELNTRGSDLKTKGTLTNPIKTYVDGVQLADPYFLSQIDPKSIERIEIITGPQASTIYGSDALNGVMQIFTKRGKSGTPQLMLNLMSGFVQNNFSSSLTPQHDASAQLNGVEGRVSYNVGTSWLYMGPWAPGVQVANLGAFGGMRYSMPTRVGPLDVDISIRRNNRINHSYSGSGIVNQGQTPGRFDVFYSNVYYDVGALQTNGQTLGLTFTYVPTSWWSHDFTWGSDVSTSAGASSDVAYNHAADTLVVQTAIKDDRRSLRYSSSLRVPITSWTQGTLSIGADGWQSLRNDILTNGTATSGQINTEGGSVRVIRRPEHNSGAFLQAQLGVVDKLFFTYGLRADWHPWVGEDFLPALAPKYGATYTTSVGAVTAKLRATYGRSTTPPSLSQTQISPNIIYGLFGITDCRVPASAPTSIYGDYNCQKANANLSKTQQGFEGGLDLYLGNRASLVVTRYNQTVDNVILKLLGADSVRSLMPNPIINGRPCSFYIARNQVTVCSSQDADGYGYVWQYQNVNAASLRNQGWELRGTLTTGPVTSSGTYSWTKSRTIGMSEKYKKNFEKLLGRLSSFQQFERGASYEFLPEHTWALSTAYARGGSRVSINVNGIGKLRNQTDAFSIQNISEALRLDQDRLLVAGDATILGDNSRYISISKGYATADLNAARQLSARVESVLEIHNLTDYYTQDSGWGLATMGRQTKFGFRLRF